MELARKPLLAMQTAQSKSEFHGHFHLPYPNTLTPTKKKGSWKTTSSCDHQEEKVNPFSLSLS